MQTYLFSIILLDFGIWRLFRNEDSSRYMKLTQILYKTVEFHLEKMPNNAYFQYKRANEKIFLNLSQVVHMVRIRIMWIDDYK